MIQFLFKKIPANFQKKKIDTHPPAAQLPSTLKTDIHSHLLPGIDDGVKTLSEAAEVIRALKALGYQKLITTPHVIQDFYPNTSEQILAKLAELKAYLPTQGIEIEIEAAAEYYLDECFLRQLEQDQPLLTFGESYVLFETGFINPPALLMEAIFMMQSSGYRPVLAHPERYTYLHEKKHLLDELLEKGVLLQVNLNSLTGHYSRASKEMAEKLLREDKVALLGSDCHGMRHHQLLQKLMREKRWAGFSSASLLNAQL